ncbi:hypothetical protein HUJ04_000546 [Dendroctonus ponderosae]|nr:hypothetical protein HUJ04_000546 [Dendroctonus ponderosae]
MIQKHQFLCSDLNILSRALDETKTLNLDEYALNLLDSREHAYTTNRSQKNRDPFYVINSPKRRKTKTVGAVTSTLHRSYGRILRNTTERRYGGHDAKKQSGFCASRSCMNNIFVFKQIIENEIVTNREIDLLFIDLQKSYDSIPISKPWKVLEETKINHMLINPMKELYKGDDQQSDKIRALEMDALRRYCGISRLQHITNESILQMTNIKETIIEDIPKKRLKSYGHVQRMPKGRLPKIAMECVSTKKRRREYP